MDMPVAETDDGELAARARAGERAAFAALVSRHYAFIFRVAWRWSANRSDAEDIAQEACVRLAKAISGFRGDAKFRTWLYRLTLSAAHDLARKRQRELRKAEAYHAYLLADVQGSSADANPLGELWDAVRKLPGKQRDAILLVYGEEMSHAEAAAVMGCKESTVSWHVHEARKKLKHLAGADGDE